MASAVAATSSLSVSSVVGCSSSLQQSANKVHNAPLLRKGSATLRSGGLKASSSVAALAERVLSQVAPFQAVKTKSAGGYLPPQGPRAAGQAYICQDCGYIYNERKPFDSLTRDYSCPVCAAPKRRFKPYNTPVAKGANNQGTRKARKAELQSSANPLPAVIGGIVLVLAGTYFYLNTVPL